MRFIELSSREDDTVVYDPWAGILLNFKFIRTTRSCAHYCHNLDSNAVDQAILSFASFFLYNCHGGLICQPVKNTRGYVVKATKPRETK